MYLARKYGWRKKGPPREYLYIRRRGYRGYLSRDIPLGRMDRGEPEDKVMEWLEDSSTMPEPLQILEYQEVKRLYYAITQNDSWWRLERLYCARRPAYKYPWKT